MDSNIRYEPLREQTEPTRSERQPFAAGSATPTYSLGDPERVHLTGAPVNAVPPPNYAAYPQQYPQQYPQYQQPQYQYPSGTTVPPPMAPMAMPPGQMPPGMPPAGYVAPPTVYVAPPGMSGPVIVTRTIAPPAPYVPPILPSDPSLASKFTMDSVGMMDSEKNYTWKGGDVGLDDLRNFFLSQMGAPECRITVMGWHEVSTTRTQPNGQQITETSRKTDWSFDIDMKPWVLAPGELRGALGLEEAVDKFARSKASIKRMELSKSVQFDLQRFEQSALAMARQRGYRHHVTANFSYPNNSRKISLLAPNECYLMCNQPICKFLMCITCLCLIWYPMKSCMEENFQLTQILPTAITPEQLMEINQQQIPYGY